MKLQEAIEYAKKGEIIEFGDIEFVWIDNGLWSINCNNPGMNITYYLTTEGIFTCDEFKVKKVKRYRCLLKFIENEIIGREITPYVVSPEFYKTIEEVKQCFDQKRWEIIRLLTEVPEFEEGYGENK